MGLMHLHRFLWADLVLEEIHKFLRLARVNVIYKCLENHEKMLQEVKGSSRAWCLHSVPQKDGKIEKSRERAQRRDQSSRLTTISSQQAVEGSFPVIPKKTSSVPTCCLNEISYLPKRSHCLEQGQETKGDCDSQRTENPPHTVSPPLQSPFKAPIHLHWASAQSHDWESWKTGEDQSLHLPKHSPCCLCFPHQPLQDQEMLPKCIQCLSTSQTPQTLGEGIWKGGCHSCMCSVLLFCPLAYFCSLSRIF